MNLPTEEQCRALWDEYETPKNVREHCIQVARVADFLAARMNAAGVAVNENLVHASALLHDLLRFLEFAELCDPSTNKRFSARTVQRWQDVQREIGLIEHEDAGFRVLKEAYPELARIIQCHGYSGMGCKSPPKTWEEKIVSYADKRVKHDQIVSLDERFRDGRERCGIRHQREGILDAKYRGLEKEIFNIVKLDPLRIEECL